MNIGCRPGSRYVTFPCTIFESHISSDVPHTTLRAGWGTHKIGACGNPLVLYYCIILLAPLFLANLPVILFKRATRLQVKIKLLLCDLAGTARRQCCSFETIEDTGDDGDNLSSSWSADAIRHLGVFGDDCEMTESKLNDILQWERNTIKERDRCVKLTIRRPSFASTYDAMDTMRARNLLAKYRDIDVCSDGGI